MRRNARPPIKCHLDLWGYSAEQSELKRQTHVQRFGKNEWLFQSARQPEIETFRSNGACGLSPYRMNWFARPSGEQSMRMGLRWCQNSG
jgi:hypothetical protein